VAGYSFGDSDLAAERLRVLDEVFAPTTDALLAAVPVTPATVADLGCGPGATTARLLRRFPDARVTGVDASEPFLTRARAAVPDAAFVCADLGSSVPGGPFDLVYARFLLAHLPDVGGAIGRWLAALAPGGALVLEETERIASDDEWFARYEELSAARVGATGAKVDAGSAIAAAVPECGAAVLVDRVLTLDLTAGQAAGMFWRNLATWGDEAVTDGLIADADRGALLAHLRGRVDDATLGIFTWTHRQTVLRRG
jgi:SAM-dependent methyltransferase